MLKKIISQLDTFQPGHLVRLCLQAVKIYLNLPEPGINHALESTSYLALADELTIDRITPQHALLTELKRRITDSITVLNNRLERNREIGKQIPLIAFIAVTVFVFSFPLIYGGAAGFLDDNNPRNHYCGGTSDSDAYDFLASNSTHATPSYDCAAYHDGMLISIIPFLAFIGFVALSFVVFVCDGPNIVVNMARRITNGVSDLLGRKLPSSEATFLRELLRWLEENADHDIDFANFERELSSPQNLNGAIAGLERLHGHLQIKLNRLNQQTSRSSALPPEWKELTLFGGAQNSPLHNGEAHEASGVTIISINAQDDNTDDDTSTADSNDTIDDGDSNDESWPLLHSGNYQNYGTGGA